jgi:hypothetical protein
MDSWQTVFVFRDRCVERVDTPELVQPMELDRAHANKERKRALKKAYREKNSDSIKARKRAQATKERKRDLDKAYREKNADIINARNKIYKQNNADIIKASNRAYSHKKYAANPEKYMACKRAYKLRKYGCVECKKWPDGQRGCSHYDGMCFRCFSKEFPHDERVKTRGRVELRVRSYIDSHFPDFVHDQPIHTAHCVCSHRRRINHRRLIGNTLLCVETDENFHKYYDPDDEEARYHDVITAFGGKLCFVRFNPHKFNLDDRHDLGPPLAERLERLRAEVTRHIGLLERGENRAFLEVWHLYYPEGTEDY